MPIDMSAAKAPPTKRATPSARARKVEVKTDTRTLAQQRTDGLLGLGQLGQGLCLMTKNYADAAAIGMHWPPIATELAILAETQPVVASAVDIFVQAGPYAALVTAIIPFAAQIAANHGWIDARNMVGSNVVPPDVLTAQMQANIARMQADALRERQEAIAEAQKAQAEYEAMMQHDGTAVSE